MSPQPAFVASAWDAHEELERGLSAVRPPGLGRWSGKRSSFLMQRSHLHTQSRHDYPAALYELAGCYLKFAGGFRCVPGKEACGDKRNAQ